MPALISHGMCVQFWGVVAHSHTCVRRRCGAITYERMIKIHRDHDMSITQGRGPFSSDVSHNWMGAFAVVHVPLPPSVSPSLQHLFRQKWIVDFSVGKILQARRPYTRAISIP